MKMRNGLRRWYGGTSFSSKRNRTESTAFKNAILSFTVILSIATAGAFCRSAFGDEQPNAPDPSTPPGASALSATPKANAPDRGVVSVSESRTLRITLKEAVLNALENNRSLAVQRLAPAISKTFITQERAAFDPVISAEISARRTDTQRQTSSGNEDADANIYQGAVSLQQFFPTGTFVEASGIVNKTDASQYTEPLASSRLGVAVNQPLLQGAGRAVNLASIRLAERDAEISAYELVGFTESLVADIETAYWNYVLAKRRIEIFEESLKLAERQLFETKEMINVGAMAEAELAAVQAEVASQRQGLINAKSQLEMARLRLLRLVNPKVEDMWELNLQLVHEPVLPTANLSPVAEHVSKALRMRSEINEAELEIQKGDIQLIRTRNGLLPKLDLFIELGKTGYADSFAGSAGGLTDDGYDVAGGVSLAYPIFNRSASAQHKRALLRRDQAEKSLENLKQLVQLDVRGAYIEVNRAQKQIAAGMATRKFNEEKLRIETEKFRVGRSTNLLVSQAQRDLLVSRIAEVEAVINYIEALIDFYRLEGSLLEKRGIVISAS